MRQAFCVLLSALAAIALVSPSLFDRRTAQSSVPVEEPGAPDELLARQPFAFVQNRGQLDEAVRFYAQRGDSTSFLTDDGFSVSVHAGADAPVAGVHLRFLFEDRRDARPTGERELPGRVNFLKGDEPGEWVTGAESFEVVRYTGLYDNVDLALHGRRGHLEYDLEFGPWARPEDVVVRIDGAGELALEQGGAVLRIETAIGPVRQELPRTWQIDHAGRAEELEARFRLLGPDRFGFEVEGRDPELALVVDPVLVFSSYIGGTACEFGRAVVVDDFGECYVTGLVQSLDYPTTAGAIAFAGNTDVFVTKMDTLGATTLYSTYLGSPSDDMGHAIAVNGSGEAVVAGRTEGAGFPTTANAGDATHNGGHDVFVAQLDAAGQNVIYGTYLGSPGDEEANGVAIDAAGAIYVGGSTDSAQFPSTAGAFQSHQGGRDGFVSKIAPAGSFLEWGTFVGGSGTDTGTALALGGIDNVYLVGWTTSSNFPTVAGSFDTTKGNGRDGFAVRVASDGSSLVYSTFLGAGEDDEARGAALPINGELLVVGVTESANFPTTAGALSPTPLGGDDAFLVRLSADGTTAVYSSYLGGSADDAANAVATDPVGTAFIAGQTFSDDLPTTPGAMSIALSGPADAFFMEVDTGALGLLYSTYLGGSAEEVGYGAFQNIFTGRTCITGHALDGFQITSGVHAENFTGGSGDVFVTCFVPEPCGATAAVQTVGVPCNATLTSTLPIQGSFMTATVTNAVPSAFGFLLFSPQTAAIPFSFEGVCDFWLNIPNFFVMAPIGTDPTGTWSLPIGLPNDPPRCAATLTLQAAIFGVGGATSVGDLTNALELTLGS